MTWRRLQAIVPIMLVTMLFIGCAAKSTGRVTFHDSNMDFALVQKVAVLPFVNLTRDSNADERVRDVFMTMLQATGGLYVVPVGEVGRGISRSEMTNPLAPSPEEAIRFSKIVNADAIITGTVREYGDVRSGSTVANIVSLSLQMMEAQTGKVVWSASSTRGGVTTMDRLFGGGGEPMNPVTQKAVNDLLDNLFGK